MKAIAAGQRPQKVSVLVVSEPRPCSSRSRRPKIYWIDLHLPRDPEGNTPVVEWGPAHGGGIPRKPPQSGQIVEPLERFVNQRPSPAELDGDFPPRISPIIRTVDFPPAPPLRETSHAFWVLAPLVALAF
jgi:hypothetical protein